MKITTTIASGGPPADHTSVRQAAGIVGVSHGRIGTLVAQGRIRSVAIGNRIYVNMNDVREYGDAVKRLASIGLDRRKGERETSS